MFFFFEKNWGYIINIRLHIRNYVNGLQTKTITLSTYFCVCSFSFKVVQNWRQSLSPFSLAINSLNFLIQFLLSYTEVNGNSHKKFLFSFFYTNFINVFTIKFLMQCLNIINEIFIGMDNWNIRMRIVEPNSFIRFYAVHTSHGGSNIIIFTLSSYALSSFSIYVHR